ncbi:hypothetical protein FAZ19_20790 [Sphingobacterium alkalisoli]|uniref:Uncharacterized protein n=1 Tax=Sphingobacterium alkalisoli TaxID=1874115 RepID=A0A4U0GTW1_9SPHI|nr:hypothetical protein [Sphingobacterium alkalisoli]TJY62491.1 hypothetical protein FAZ19_20790 [Sphingobacterium alkalisoli]GGH29152.1 hypothetical protein GCM10011418_40230 [Sphingobacterium alkalisoli]
MGIRYEKDTILNWINEMGKFLRLVVGLWEGFDKSQNPVDIETGYRDFFKQERSDLLQLNEDELKQFADRLEPEQLRPLALLFLYDGLINKEVQLLQRAKLLLEYQAAKTGNFSFEDFEHLATIDRYLK